MSRRDSNSPLEWRKKYNTKQGWNPSPWCWVTEALGHMLPYLGSSSLSISIYFLFCAFPGAASSSFLIWARRIFWKSSWVKTRLVLTAAALAFRSSTGMLFSFLDLRAHNKGVHGYWLKWQLSPPTRPRTNFLSLHKHLNDALTEGKSETHNFFLFFIGRVVHVNPLPIDVWLLAETGTFPPSCVRDSTPLVTPLCWVLMANRDKWSKRNVRLWTSKRCSTNQGLSNIYC